MDDILSPITAIGDIFSGGDAPAAPNTASTIDQQKQATQLFQITPQGTLEFGTIGEGGEFIPREGAEGTRITESAFQEQFRTGSEALALELLGQTSGELGDFRSAADIEAGLQSSLTGDFADDALRIEQETFEAGQRRLDPIIEQERRDLVQNLSDRGLPLTSEAAQKELARFDQSVGDRQSDLAFGAIEAGRAEQNRLAQLTAQLRGQEVNEQLAFSNLEQQQRAQQFGEIGALGGFAAPFQPFNAPTVDVASIINQGFANQLGSANFEEQQRQANLKFIGDIASSAGQAAGAGSDFQLKENIKYHGIKNGYKLYDFDYKAEHKEVFGAERYRGVMAQDLLETNPEAVTVMDNGFYGVFYDKLGLEMEVINE